MKVVIISDSHDNGPVLERAVIKIKELNPDLVIHCGDLVQPFMLDFFVGLDLKFVFGNNDWDKNLLREKASVLGFGEPDDFLDFTFSGKRFFVTHEPKHCKKIIESQEFDYVLHGHSHSPKDKVKGRTHVINPGALYRAHYYTFGCLDLESKKVEFHKVEK